MIVPRNGVEQLELEIQNFVGLLKTQGLQDPEIARFYEILNAFASSYSNDVYQQATTDGYALAVELFNRGVLTPIKMRDAIIPAHIKPMADEYAARKLN